MKYDYEKIIREGASDLAEIKGKVFEGALVNIVADEINVVHLRFGGAWYSAHGLSGSEVIGFRRRAETFQEERIDQGSSICKLSVLEQFVGLIVAQTRHIGAAWNGHGFEISFVEEPARTLILQSIYTGSEPDGFDDCIRVGVGNYIYQVSGT